MTKLKLLLKAKKKIQTRINVQRVQRNLLYNMNTQENQSLSGVQMYLHLS
jgi:hypothetical protein